jgi:hypothetical protein
MKPADRDRTIEWKEALDAAERGRPAALAILVERGAAIPDFARERFAAYLRISRTKNTGRPSKRDADGFTQAQIDGAAAYRLQRRFLDTGHSADYAAKVAHRQWPQMSEERLKRIARRGVQEVNERLRFEGVI